ncbi:MAG: DUF4382 domain-containing protein [Leptospirales bacterium]
MVQIQKVLKSMAIVWFTLFAISCTGTSNQNITSHPDTAYGENSDQGLVGFFLTDFPIANQDVTAVNVNINKIEIYSETAGWINVIDYGDAGRNFDLLTLQNGTTAELGYFNLEPGVYKQMRLYLNDENTIEVTLNGSTNIEPLKVPSGTQTGIKLNREFEVLEQGYTSLTIDFNAEKSVHYNKGQGYMLKPVISVIDATTTQGAAVPITAASGGNVSLIGEAELSIPAGALNVDASIEIVPMGASKTQSFSSGQILSNTYDMLPDGTQFNQDITITLNYNPAEVQALGSDENLLEIAYFDTARNEWVAIGGVVNTTTKTVSAQVDHFTLFGVKTTGPTKAPKINPAQIEYATDAVTGYVSQTPTRISATIMDTTAITATLFYKTPSMAAFSSLPMVPGARNVYSVDLTSAVSADFAYILADITAASTLEVYIKAVDSDRNGSLVSYAPVTGSNPGAETGALAGPGGLFNTDVDADGMNDRWEIENGLDADPASVGSADGTLDTDGDGWDNLTEYQNGTDPNLADNPLFTIGGTLTGLQSGQLTIKNNFETLNLTANGPYQFTQSVFSGGAYSVTFSLLPLNHRCNFVNPVNNGTVGTSPVTNIDINCISPSYNVGGNVTGLTSGTLVVRNTVPSGYDDVTVTADGAFAFAPLYYDGDSYSVTILQQPVGFSCNLPATPTTGTIAGGHVSAISVTCVPTVISGAYDKTFNATGIYTYDHTGEQDQGADVAVDSQGRIIMVGTVQNAAPTYFDIAIWRFNPDGTLDGTFGPNGNGLVIYQMNGVEKSAGVYIDQNDAIFVSGFSQVSGQNLTVWKYISNGTLDTAFGTNGMAILSMGIPAQSSSGFVFSKRSNRFLVSGFAKILNGPVIAVVWKLTRSGQTDTTFNNGLGYVTHKHNDPNIYTYAYDVAFGNADDVYLTGYHTPKTGGMPTGFIMRYKNNGRPDTAFPNDGQNRGVIVPNAYLYGLHFDDASLVLYATGSSRFGTVQSMIVQAWDASNGGALNGFGVNGRATFQDYSIGQRITIDNSGRLVVAGKYSIFAGVWRVNPFSGTLDTTFAAGGSRKYDDFRNNLGAGVAIDQTNHIIITSGVTISGLNFDAIIRRINP